MEHTFMPYNPNLLEIGPLSITWYAVMIFIGLGLGSYTAFYTCKKLGIDTSKLLDAITMGFIFAIIGARLYYVLFKLEEFIVNPISILFIQNGGLAIHGALIAVAIYVIYFTKKNNINLFMMLETMVPAFFIGQSMGRWGNFMNQEAHGPIINMDPDLGRAFLENTLKLPDFITNQMYLFGEQGLNYYHPTFLYESVWNIIGALIVVFGLRKLKAYKVGDGVGFYLVWYGIGRYFVESLRTDALLLGNFKIAQIVSILMIIGGIVLVIYKHRFFKEDPSYLAAVEKQKMVLSNMPKEEVEDLNTESIDESEELK